MMIQPTMTMSEEFDMIKELRKKEITKVIIPNYSISLFRVMLNNCSDVRAVGLLDEYKKGLFRVSIK